MPVKNDLKCIATQPVITVYETFYIKQVATASREKRPENGVLDAGDGVYHRLRNVLIQTGVIASSKKRSENGVLRNTVSGSTEKRPENGVLRNTVSGGRNTNDISLYMKDLSLLFSLE